MAKRRDLDANRSASLVEAPWRPLGDKGRGYLSVYFSERMARWPVREITRPGDNKSDPNVETGTYGLFSTCEPSMRNRIVEDGASTVFFITTHVPGRGRVLAGYYHIGWYTEGAQGAINRDFALAADEVRFIDPVATNDLPGGLAGLCSAPFRQMRPLAHNDVSALLGICQRAKDRTEAYLAEVQRIELFAKSQTGYAYPSWGREDGFTWDDVAGYYQRDAELSKVPNSSKSQYWRCRDCGYVIKSGALLKRCPLCKAMSTLVPEEAP